MPYVPRWPHKRVLAFASSCALMLAFAPAAVADSSTDASATDTAAAVVVASAPASSVDATTTVDPTTLTTSGRRHGPGRCGARSDGRL